MPVCALFTVTLRTVNLPKDMRGAISGCEANSLLVPNPHAEFPSIEDKVTHETTTIKRHQLKPPYVTTYPTRLPFSIQIPWWAVFGAVDMCTTMFTNEVDWETCQWRPVP